MSSYKSFAIAGAGLIGIPVINALLQRGASVVVLSRSTKPVPTGASIATVDYSDIPALTDIIKKHAVEVIILTFGSEGLPSQPALADAGKAAGVKLFVPSEYGLPTEGAKTGLLAGKDTFIKHLTEIGLPYVRLYVGFFSSIIPWLTGIADTGKVHAIGSGDAPFSVTADEDIAGFLAHVTTSLPPSELANKSFRIQGDRATLRELATLFEKPLVLHDGPPPELSQLHAYFLGLIASGRASTGFDNVVEKDVGSADEANVLWAGHHWKSIKEFHKL